MIELIKTILLSALPQLPFKNSIPKGVSVYPNKVNTQREKKSRKLIFQKHTSSNLEANTLVIEHTYLIEVSLRTLQEVTMLKGRCLANSKILKVLTWQVFNMPPLCAHAHGQQFACV